MMIHATPSISEQIALYYEAADQNKIPEEVIYHAKECILDFLGCAIGGADLETTKIAKRTMMAAEPHGACSVLVGEKAPADKAAFINGTSSHGLEMDDSNTQAGGHPGSVIISAALAAAEEEGVSGIELIRAVIWGYDIMVRVARAAIPDNCFERGWHPTAIFGIFGAAMATAYIKRLNASQMANAMGVAGGFAAGNLECYADNSFTKRLNPGNASDRGYIAAKLAQLGYIGPRWIFEGDHGFLHAYSDNYDAQRMLENLDYSEYPLMYTSFKPYPSCRYTHAPIDSVLKIREGYGVKPEDIDRIVVDYCHMAIRAVVEPRELKYAPDNIAGAQFSLPFTVGCAALYGKVSITEFTEEKLSDPALKEMIDKVEMQYTGKMDEYLPHIFASEVMIKAKNGKEYSELTTFTKGDPEAPITPTELKEKFLSLSRLNMAEERAIKIYNAVSDLDRINVKDLAALL